jgi:hypothetical protein
LGCAVAIASGLIGAASAMAASSPLQLNESYVEEVTRDHGFDIADKKAVFGFVFKNLPERVKIYPTEHYYYFKFSHRGVVYSGNFRLQREERDQGKMHFAYAAEFSYWLPPGDTQHTLLEAKDGVQVERVDDWTYRASYEGKSVVFELNRMEGVKPPDGILAPQERYIGPVYDESAIRFFLVYNPMLKQFHYLLDETGPPADVLMTSEVSDRILIGQRTGFAFYRDHKLDRRILIGVYEGNSRINNFFDGPFDQLPDDFLEGDVLRDAILDVAPELKGQIDRYGSSFDGETRYMIAPYLHYGQESDLGLFHRCATNKRISADRYHACFVLDESDPERLSTAAERQQRTKTDRPAREKRNR